MTARKVENITLELTPHQARVVAAACAITYAARAEAPLPNAGKNHAFNTALEVVLTTLAEKLKESQ